MNNKKLIKGVALILAIVCPAVVSLRAEEASRVAQIFPITAELNGGFASYGGTKIEDRKDSNVLFVSNEQAIGFVRWFVTHKPVSKQQGAEWAPDQIRLEVRSVLAPISVEVTAAWRGSVDPAELGAASKERFDIGEEWTTIVLPVPESDSIVGKALTGILFRFNKGGEFEIKSIDIVSDGSPSQSQAAPISTPAPSASLQPQVPQQADVAAIKVGRDGQPDPGFVAAHERNVARAKKGDIDCLLLGDSITLNWGKYRSVWDKYFGSYKTANFGVGGDCTQHVLWRIQNGELDGINPKVIVLMIGTNNTNYFNPEPSANGVRLILDTIKEKCPTSKVLLLGALPRGEKPNPYRAKNDKLNSIIQGFADGQTVYYLDMGDKFLQPDGSISSEIMPDFLHPSEVGYQIWADAMSPQLARLMN